MNTENLLTKKIYIEQGKNCANTSFKAFMRLENAKIISVKGISGLTQFEDEGNYAVLKKNETNYLLPAFIFSHYYTLEFTIQYAENAFVYFCESNDKVRFDLNNTNFQENIKVNDTTTFFIYDYQPQQINYGKCEVYPQKAIAGTHNKFYIKYTANCDLNEGFKVIFHTPYSAWSKPAEKVKIILNTNAEIKVILNRFYYAIRGYEYVATIKKGILKKGQSFEIEYGGVAAGVSVQQYPQEKVYFLLREGYGKVQIYKKLAETPYVSIIAAKAAKIRLKAPYFAPLNKEIYLEGIVLDEFNNAVVYNGTVTVKYMFSNVEKILSADVVNGKFSVKALMPNEENFIKFIAFINENRALIKGELVILTKSGEEKLFFGQIHGHSEVSDGTFSMEDYFKYGKETGLLDFCALSDHDWEIVEHPRNKDFHGLQKLCEIVEKYNSNDYATLLGYEWMDKGTHVNVYFSDVKNYEIKVGSVCFVNEKSDYDTLEKFLKSFENEDSSKVLLIPHLSHGYDWTADSNKIAAVEIASCWGQSELCSPANSEIREKGAFALLKQGKKFAFVGGGDNHHGSPGQLNSLSRYSIQNCLEGLCGIYANSLDRKSVFNAIKNGKCYAVYGVRVILDVQQKLSENFYEVSGRVACEKNIRCVELVSEDNIEVFTIEAQYAYFELKIKRTFKDNEFYYLRVKDENNITVAWLI